MSERDPRTYAVIGAAMEVHRELGPGYLERVYQDALEVEFKARDIPYQRERVLAIRYKSVVLPSSYRSDYVCFDDLLVETKAQKALTDIDGAQLINYLKGTGFEIGLLINFGTPSLEYRRMIHSSSASSA